MEPDKLVIALSEIAASVQKARSVSGVFAAAGEGLLSLGLELIVAQLHEPDETTIRYMAAPVRASFQGGAGAAATSPIRVKLPENAPMRRALATGRPFFAGSLQKEASSFLKQKVDSAQMSQAALARAAVRQAVIAPLFMGGKPWGSLTVMSEWLNESHLPALGLFAAHVCSAMEMAQHVEELIQRNWQLEALQVVASAPDSDDVPMLTKALLVASATATHADAVSLHLWNETEKRYVLAAPVFGYQGDLVDRYAEVRERGWVEDGPKPLAFSRAELPSHLADVAQSEYAHFALVPFVARGQVQGFLGLARREDRRFTPEELRVAEIVGAQVTLQIERARLRTQTGQQLRHLRLLFDLAKTASTVRVADALIEALMPRMLEAFPVDVVAVHLVEDEKLHLKGYRVAPASGLSSAIPSAAPVEINEDTVVGLTASDMTLHHGTYATFPVLTKQYSERLGVKSLMCAPMIVQKLLLGTISVGRKDDRGFDDDEQRLLESCAAHMSDYIENAQLYEGLKESYSVLQTTQVELLKHERLAGLGELAAVMAHEVRNPLGAIFNSLNTLRRVLPEKGEAAVLVNILSEESDRLNRIVGDLLDFARPYAPVRSLTALEPIVVGAVEAAMQAVPTPGIRVVTEIPEGLPRFALDAQLVRQVLMNLIINAIQAMSRGGAVTVRLKAEVEHGRPVARLEVTDEGSGISKADSEKIFQPFFTTKATGTGLGLAVVKRIVEAHQGDIAVTSEEGGGTTFIVRLPQVTTGAMPVA